MPIKIKSIQKRSLASTLPIKIGNEILKIDNQPINDILDLMFYSQKEEFTLEYRDKEIKSCQVKNNFDKPLGIEAELPPCQNCVNNCIFCFVDQMPKGLRDSLYVKDDDFIYSFFYGNFITLTNLTKKNINKIITQNISPLYVSVHTTNPILHKNLLRYNHSFNILEALKKLQDHNIEIHAQIVVIPDYNDKSELFKTLTDLVEMENVTTIGIVPIGITKYRDNLANLRKLTQNEARELITHTEYMKSMRGMDHIYCADEIFILAELPFPEDSYYGNYDQIENGIGLARKTLENWKYSKRKLVNMIKNHSGNPVFITSISGIHAINPILKDIQKSIPEKKIIVNIIKNKLFGEEVTVTGLLSWADIKSGLFLKDDEYLILPSSIFNQENFTIDNFHLDDIKKEMQVDIIVVDEMFACL